MNNIPKGYKLVPVEPTDEMIMAFITKQAIGFSDEYPSVRFGGNYRAMLAATPTPPQPIFDEAKEREMFEAWSAEHYYLGGCTVVMEDGEYKDTDMQYSWESWEARAKAGEVGHE